MKSDILTTFHPAVRGWFLRTFGTPTAPQELGWPPIAAGRHTLIVAPTGTGKTLAAFLWCLNRLIADPPDDRPGVRVLYISPLKALNNDIYRNLETPLRGIAEEAAQLANTIPAIDVAVRTGDTTAAQRRTMLKRPPHILITTPESLYLLLTSPQGSRILRTVHSVIVDEIHSVYGSKRGVHLSLSLERLEEIAAASFTRIGLSATQRPLDLVARFLGGQEQDGGTFRPRRVEIVDAGRKKELRLTVSSPVADFSDLPDEGVWPYVYPRLLDIITHHRTTLIFVNNRRLAERTAARLNAILSGVDPGYNEHAVPMETAASAPRRTAEELFVQAYHSSMSRSAREKMEQDLKAGRLRALVATSSLELGIDIGTIDCVIQIQSPKGVGRGLQRVGRSGHMVGAASNGTILATHRDDLVESSAIGRAMLSAEIEETHAPENCLDVLAQQIVACVGVEEWEVDRLYELVQRSYCYRSLSRKLFMAVVEMLAGRFEHEAFRELRARISWDKVRGTLSALPGSARLAITNGGTIPDRGYYPAYLEDGKTKIGELDEEFMYESRVGDTFILGSNTWKMMRIEPNRILVAPAPGQPARMPFWKGEQPGRHLELAEQIGTLLEFLAGHADDPDVTAALMKEYPIDVPAAWNLKEYVRSELEAIGVVPTHRRIVIEGFRDEIGDPRIVVHSCFGRGINALLSMVIAHRLRSRLSLDIQSLYNDNGILVRCADADRLPLDFLHGLTVEEAATCVLDHVDEMPVFGSLFRQNAGRALLLPPKTPGKRRPLWLQRLRAGDLLQLTKSFPDFPIVIETFRECLNDTLNLSGFRDVVGRIVSGEISLHTVERETPSPFATTLLFDFVAQYMYEGDRAGPGIAARRMDEKLLADVVPLASLRSVVQPEALGRVEDQLQNRAAGRRARSVEELLELFLHLGELTVPEIAERCEADPTKLLGELVRRGSIVPFLLRGETAYCAGEDAALYAAFASVADGVLARLPEELRQPAVDRRGALSLVLLRFLRTHGPVRESVLRSRYGIDEDECRSLLLSLSRREPIEHAASFGASTSAEVEGDEEWCYRPNLDRIHRASLTFLRQQIRPATLAAFTSFLLRWQHRLPSAQLTGPGAIREVLDQLQGCSAPVELWETEILPSRLRGYDPSELRQVTSRGEVIAIGLPAGKLAWGFRGDAGFILPEKESAAEGLSPRAKELYEYLRSHGASFLADLRSGLDISLAALNKAVAELWWNSLITNDVVDEFERVKRYRDGEPTGIPDQPYVLAEPRHNPLKSRAMQTVRKALKSAPGWEGRWSVLHSRAVLGAGLDLTERASRQAVQLLSRYGVVAKEIAKREEGLLPWPLLFAEFQKMEMRGEIRRGYFVEGLSGMQFAVHEAGEALQASPEAGEDVVTVVNACDPAQPYGSGIALAVDYTLVRVPQNYLALRNGTPVCLIENYGSRISRIGETTDGVVARALEEFIRLVRTAAPGRRDLIVETCDGKRPSESSMKDLLAFLGFYRDRAQSMRLELR